MRPYTLRPLARRRLLGGLTTPSYPRRLHPFAPPLPPCLRHPPTTHPATHQHRTFWSRKKAPPNPRSTTPGIDPIERLVGSLNTQEGRPPPDTVLVSAFHDLVGSWRGGPILDEHAHGLARTYEYLRTSPRGVTIPTTDLRAALRAVQRGGSTHLAGLARVLFNGVAAAAEEVTQDDVLPFVRVLCNSGGTAEAVEVVRRWGRVLDEGAVRLAWERVLRGFAREGDEETLLQTWELLKALGVELGVRQYYQMVRFYCKEGQLESAKVWYGKVLEAGLEPTLHTSAEMLRLCAEKGRLEWGQEILDRILAGGEGGLEKRAEMANISKEAWEVVLQWTAVMGKGLEGVDYLLDLMTEAAEKGETSSAPDIETANKLIRFAIEREHKEMAAHYLGIAMKRGFEYNRTTLELQVSYNLLSNNTEGARKVYEGLRREEIPKGYEAREVKQLLRALCTSPEKDIEKINQVYLDLNDWSVKLEPETLTPLLNVFLEKCIFQEVIELLNRDCHKYSARDRRKVIHEIGEYIGRNTTSIEAAWDSYQILYQFFPELSVRQRTDIMRLFFELGRSDMATLVFQHMRGTPERRPDIYTYAIAFTGVAYARDLDALRAVHNALKLDHLIEPDTLLMNSLMAAYSHCGIPERSLRFWEEIKKSREGPDYTSISIVLDTCGKLWDGGVGKAKIVWGQLRAMGVKPKIENYCSYVEALGSNMLWEESFRVVKEMEALDGVRPDFKILGTVYAVMVPARRAEVEEWARGSYPAEWEEVEGRLAGLPAGLPADVSEEEILERLGSGQLQRLAQQSRDAIAALEKVERGKLPVYTRS